jgi:hypothetical protein
MAAAFRVAPADDDEFLAVEAFGLQPCAAARLITLQAHGGTWPVAGIFTTSQERRGIRAPNRCNSSRRAVHCKAQGSLAHPARLPNAQLCPSWNVAPIDSLPIVRDDPKAGHRTIDLMRWGLVPYWAKDLKIGFSTINAMAETVDTKATVPHYSISPQRSSPYLALNCANPRSQRGKQCKDRDSCQPHPAGSLLTASAEIAARQGLGLLTERRINRKRFLPEGAQGGVG